jgi:primosomal protein N'
MYAEIALPSTGFLTFTYIVPEHYQSVIAPGVPVVVPLRNSQLVGVVLSLSTHSDIPKKRLKPIAGLIDPIFNLEKRQLELLRWIAEYYLCPIGDVIRSAYPPGFIGRANMTVVASDLGPVDKNQLYVYEKIRAHADGYPFNKKKPILSGVSNSLI